MAGLRNMTRTQPSFPQNPTSFMKTKIIQLFCFSLAVRSCTGPDDITASYCQRIRGGDSHSDSMNKASLHTQSQSCVWKPTAMKHSFSFLCRLSNETPFFVCVCGSSQGFHVFISPHLSASVYIFPLVSAGVRAGRATRLVYIYLHLGRPCAGFFGLYWHFYCLLEQIEGVTPSSVAAIFQRRNQESIDFYLNKCSGNRREPRSRPKGFDIMRPST